MKHFISYLTTAGAVPYINKYGALVKYQQVHFWGNYIHSLSLCSCIHLWYAWNACSQERPSSLGSYFARGAFL